MNRSSLNSSVDEEAQRAYIGYNIPQQQLNTTRSVNNSMSSRGQVQPIINDPYYQETVTDLPILQNNSFMNRGPDSTYGDGPVSTYGGTIGNFADTSNYNGMNFDQDNKSIQSTPSRTSKFTYSGELQLNLIYNLKMFEFFNFLIEF
jgi:hypothetical protein